MPNRSEDDRQTLNEEMLNALTHLIVEAGIVPGVNTDCRCDECKLICESMEEAGYLGRIEDRWWEENNQ